MRKEGESLMLLDQLGVEAREASCPCTERQAASCRRVQAVRRPCGLQGGGS